MSVIVHAQGKKTVHAGRGGVVQCQNSLHVVVECPNKVSSETDFSFRLAQLAGIFF